jgi:transcriptional regulator with XRE-family HTH domain
MEITMQEEAEDYKRIDEIEKEMSAKELGDEIKRLRLKAGWLQKDLAKRIGLYQTGVSDMENGNHTYPLETVYRLAAAFNINPFTLAAIYWGVDLDNFSNRDREFIDSMLKLLDEYRAGNVSLPPPPARRHISDKGLKSVEDYKASKRKKKSDQPADDTP